MSVLVGLHENEIVRRRGAGKRDRAGGPAQGDNGPCRGGCGVPQHMGGPPGELLGDLIETLGGFVVPCRGVRRKHDTGSGSDELPILDGEEVSEQSKGSRTVSPLRIG